MSNDTAPPADDVARRNLAGEPRWLSHLLRHAEHGSIVIDTPSRRWIHRGVGYGPDAHIVLHRWAALRRLLSGGDVGFAESFCAGDWWSPDLVAFFTWVAANERALVPAWRGQALVRLWDRIGHARRANSRRGSRHNISAHYDLGNDFYAAWLDSGMNYSSGLYSAATLSLEQAQSAKIERAMHHLHAAPDDHVLEIGCGWGPVAEHLARRGQRVTGITLSQQQLSYARARLGVSGLTHLADIRFADYRDMTGTFDHIISIEMLEAVGEAFWPLYFERVAALLRPGGRAVLQVITIAEDRFEDYRRRPDFIQRYIFPGGMLPTRTLIATHATDAGLRLRASEHFGQSYATTLAAWRHRFQTSWPKLAERGFDDRFRRRWQYYLAYCEAGFSLGLLDVGFYCFDRDVAL